MIKKNGEVSYAGAVLKVESRYWMDGMESEYAVVWNGNTVRHIEVGYYGSDGCNLYGGVEVTIDATDEVKRQVLRHIKDEARTAYCRSVTEYKNSIHRGAVAKVVKGRKVPKGTLLDVFWVGERPTYRSRRYSWMHETEEIAGAYTADGDKVWIKTEYLVNAVPIKSPRASERKKYIKDYVRRNAPAYGIHLT